jgi:hypothetical protein
MRVAKGLAATSMVVMAAMLVHGFTEGRFWEEGGVLTSIPWGRVSLADVYVGFALFGGWVAFREPSKPRAAVWIISILVLGNMVSGLYALVALGESRGSWPRFWLGHRAER